MELGNMIFGNSRGEYPVNRDWQKDFCDFLRKCGLDGRGYYDVDDQYQTNRGGFENDIFLVNPYDWDADCDCGFDDLEYEWWNVNKHTEDCFLNRRKLYENELKNKNIEWLGEKYISLIDTWARENGWVHGWSGSGSYCDCGVHESYVDWTNAKGHEKNCRSIQPNFLYKPTGYQIQWYKYPLRDSYMNQDFTYEQLEEIMQHCIESVRN
ncbi:hypothetical protein [Brevibacillus sp. NRS-1366]|uniref:hypothetical protein n=1 Tax=Brevibacillus sp. NRS-1366 TaxID=3233899 RepID=UPI003D200EA3